jgi:hypothetical protein
VSSSTVVLSEKEVSATCSAGLVATGNIGIVIGSSICASPTCEGRESDGNKRISWRRMEPAFGLREAKGKTFSSKTTS